MGWRFRKSVRLGGGVRLNLSRSGIGVSVGVKGFRVGVGPRGGRITASIPGTGISYQSSFGTKRRGRRARSAMPVLPARPGAPRAVPAPPRKNIAVAYLLCLPLGLLGAHRYYLGKTGTAVAQTLTLGGLGLWWLVDLFLMPRMTDQANRAACSAAGKPDDQDWQPSGTRLPENTFAVEKSCPSCGARVSRSARFCRTCGAPLQAVSEAGVSAAPAGQGWRWRPRHFVLIGLLVAFFVIVRSAGEDQLSSSGPVRSTGIATAAVPLQTLTPTLTISQWKASYPELADVREIVIRPGPLIGQKMSLRGEIVTIRVAREGYVFELGDETERQFQAMLQVEVEAPEGSSETLVVGYNGDTKGMFERTHVAVYGTLVDQETFTNAFGGKITQPLIAADLVEIDPPDRTT
jgi:TM2 domain-containing membrane protein YozV/predicted RNA-binding Zn-ribbon protein involved in translation (DUF1610 family)